MYGYDQAANKSFKSETIPNGVRTQVEDGIHALFVPPGVEIDLGDFSGSCISNPNLCENFTVSFLFRSGAEKGLKVLDSGVKYDDRDEYGWSFEISSTLVGEAVVMVSDGNSELYFEKLAGTNSWIQMVFTFDPDSSSRSVVLYQNGSHGDAPMGSSSVSLQDRNTRLKLGSRSNTKGFFISNLNFFGIKLKVDEIEEHGNRSFKEAMEVNNVTIEILEAQVIIPADSGMAVIRMLRQGFLAIATAVDYDTKSLTAEPNMHFKAATGKQLAFAPGEIFKEVKIGIINKDNSFEGNRTFQVIFSSPHSSVILKGPKQVNVTIMYTKGEVHSKGAIMHGDLLYGLLTALISLIGLFNLF